MSELPGRQKYVRLTQGQILVRPDQKRLAKRAADARTIGISQLVRELFDFGRDYNFFTPDLLNDDNLPEEG